METQHVLFRGRMLYKQGKGTMKKLARNHPKSIVVDRTFVVFVERASEGC